MTKTYFRVQAGDRDVTGLLAPDVQSRAWGHEHLEDDGTTRNGVSVCESRDALAAYLATRGEGIEFGCAGWVLVELRGEISADQPLDADAGELLIYPTEIVKVALIDDELFEKIGNAYEQLGG